MRTVSKVYMVVHIVPFLLFKRDKWRKDKKGETLKLAYGIARSCAFLYFWMLIGAFFWCHDKRWSKTINSKSPTASLIPSRKVQILLEPTLLLCPDRKTPQMARACDVHGPEIPRVHPAVLGQSQERRHDQLQIRTLDDVFLCHGGAEPRLLHRQRQRKKIHHLRAEHYPRQRHWI